MTDIVLKAYAKINLFLDICGVRDDGYHDLRMVMQSVSLHDTVTVQADGLMMDRIELICTDPVIPVDERNIAWQAAKSFFYGTGIRSGRLLYSAFP